MPMIFRRSWEKQVFGRAGAISSALASRTGTDGAFQGSPTWSATTADFTSATAAFVAGDVGRLIRLTGTPSKRYDGYYIIDTIVSGSRVTLRKNHNITSHPGSNAQFGESGSSITWRISEACTFTTDTAGDLSQTTHPGAYVNITGASNSNNNGLWRISHFLTNQTCILSKSYIWYVADVQAYAAFTSDDTATFTAESGLYWSITDREPFNGADSMESVVQAAIDAGWVLWQQRGSLNTANTTQNILGDVILRSVGETDANLPEGKLHYLRIMWGGNSRTALGCYQLLKTWWGIGLAYDRTATPGTSPGSGLGFMRGSNVTQPPINTFNMTTITAPSTGDISFDSELSSGGEDLLTPGRGGQSLRYFRKDFLAWGDADEFHAYWAPNPGQGTTSPIWMGWGWIKPVGQNPYVCALNAVTTGGAVASKTFNTGAHDLSANGYLVGDRIFVRGIKATGTEYVEGGTITAFGGSAPNFTVTATSLAAAWKGEYGAGTDTYRGYIGADPFPIALYYNGFSGIVVRFHNTANLQEATGRDFDFTNLGLAAFCDVSVGAWTTLTPNYRTANPGVSTLQLRYDTTNEFRGKAVHIQYMRADVLPLGKKLFDPVAGVYWVLFGFSGGVGVATLQNSGAIAGPFSKIMAGLK